MYNISVNLNCILVKLQLDELLDNCENDKWINNYSINGRLIENK